MFRLCSTARISTALGVAFGMHSLPHSWRPRAVERPPILPRSNSVCRPRSSANSNGTATSASRPSKALLKVTASLRIASKPSAAAANRLDNRTDIRIRMIVEQRTRSVEIWESDPNSTLFVTDGSHKGTLSEDLQAIAAEWTTEGSGMKGTLRLRPAAIWVAASKPYSFDSLPFARVVTFTNSPAASSAPRGNTSARWSAGSAPPGRGRRSTRRASRRRARSTTPRPTDRLPSA